MIFFLDTIMDRLGSIMRKRAHELMLIVDAHKDIPLYQQVYKQIVQCIEAGTLAAGDRLPSIREIAADLNVSHITIERAYLQLSTEGYVANKPRSGFMVEHIDSNFFNKKSTLETDVHIPTRTNNDTFSIDSLAGCSCRYDFSWTKLPADSFPRKTWARMASASVTEMDDQMLTGYIGMHRSEHLKKSLAGYIGRTRHVQCRPEQIFIVGGTTPLLSLILQAIGSSGATLGVEDPGWQTARKVATYLGMHVAPLPITGHYQTFLETTNAICPDAVFVTPSHQFPTGMVMPMDARVELLKQAQHNNFFIIEDDACNEYRYATNSIPPLYALDGTGRVIYLGCFSKTLSPSLRIAFAVIPPSLLPKLWENRITELETVSLLEQETLARFIDAGEMDAHVRRTTTTLRHRHDVLLEELMSQFGYRISISGIDSGLHFLVSVDNGMTEQELVESARENGVNVFGAGQCWFAHPPNNPHVMIGFSAITIEDIKPGVRALKQAWLPSL